MFAIGWGANQFVSLLIAYRQHAGVTVGAGEALVGVYAVGLIPALLLGGPVADKFGRSRVLRPAALVSVLATVVLMTGAHALAPLYLGRFLAGVASGGAFAAGTAWVEELSSAPWDSSAAEGTGARRSAIALSAGFGLGPVVAGLIAQWAPNPLVSAYVPHLIVIVLALPGLWRAPETVQPVADSPGLLERMRVPSAGHARFVGVVMPLAPWVFAAPTIGFAVLPGLVSGHTGGLQVAFAAAIGGTVLSFGVLVQPIARRLDAADASRGASVGLLAVVGGILIAALAAAATNPLLVVPRRDRARRGLRALPGRRAAGGAAARRAGRPRRAHGRLLRNDLRRLRGARPVGDPVALRELSDAAAGGGRHRRNGSRHRFGAGQEDAPGLTAEQ